MEPHFILIHWAKEPFLSSDSYPGDGGGDRCRRKRQAGDNPPPDPENGSADGSAEDQTRPGNHPGPTTGSGWCRNINANRFGLYELRERSLGADLLAIHLRTNPYGL